MIETTLDILAFLGILGFVGLIVYVEYKLSCRSGNHIWNGNVCQKCGLVRKPMTVRKK